MTAPPSALTASALTEFSTATRVILARKGATEASLDASLAKCLERLLRDNIARFFPAGTTFTVTKVRYGGAPHTYEPDATIYLNNHNQQCVVFELERGIIADKAKYTKTNPQFRDFERDIAPTIQIAAEVSGALYARFHPDEAPLHLTEENEEVFVSRLFNLLALVSHANREELDRVVSAACTEIVRGQAFGWSLLPHARMTPDGEARVRSILKCLSAVIPIEWTKALRTQIERAHGFNLPETRLRIKAPTFIRNFEGFSPASLVTGNHHPVTVATDDVAYRGLLRVLIDVTGLRVDVVPADRVAPLNYVVFDPTVPAAPTVELRTPTRPPNVFRIVPGTLQGILTTADSFSGIQLHHNGYGSFRTQHMAAKVHRAVAPFLDRKVISNGKKSRNPRKDNVEINVPTALREAVVPLGLDPEVVARAIVKGEARVNGQAFPFLFKPWDLRYTTLEQRGCGKEGHVRKQFSDISILTSFTKHAAKANSTGGIAIAAPMFIVLGTMPGMNWSTVDGGRFTPPHRWGILEVHATTPGAFLVQAAEVLGYDTGDFKGEDPLKWDPLLVLIGTSLLEPETLRGGDLVVPTGEDVRAVCRDLAESFIRYCNPRIPTVWGMDDPNRFPIDEASLILGDPIPLKGADTSERGLIKYIGGTAWSAEGYRPNDAEVFPVQDPSFADTVARVLSFTLWKRYPVLAWLEDRAYSPDRAARLMLRDLTPSEIETLQESVRLSPAEVLMFRVMVDHIVRIAHACAEAKEKLATLSS